MTFLGLPVGLTKDFLKIIGAIAIRNTFDLVEKIHRVGHVVVAADNTRDDVRCTNGFDRFHWTRVPSGIVPTFARSVIVSVIVRTTIIVIFVDTDGDWVGAMASNGCGSVVFYRWGATGIVRKTSEQ